MMVEQNPIWGRQDPGGPHIGPMNFAIWDMQGDLLQIQSETIGQWGNLRPLLFNLPYLVKSDTWDELSWFSIGHL